MNRAFLFGLLMMSLGLAAGCGSEIECACDKVQECTSPGFEVDVCTDQVEQALDDGRATQSQVDACTSCLDGASCNAINIDDACDDECDGLSIL